MTSLALTHRLQFAPATTALLLAGLLGVFPMTAGARTARVCRRPAVTSRASRRSATDPEAAHEEWVPEARRLPIPQLRASEVAAGDRVLIRWPTLAEKAEELELVFSLDDGTRFDVRVSPQLAGGQHEYLWRVPNVGVRRARLKLRARIGGHELSGPESEAFRIVSNPARTPGLWAYRDGEWWEDGAGVPFDMPGVLTPPRAPSLYSDDSASPAAVPVRAPARVEPVLASEPAYVAQSPPQASPDTPSAAPQPFHSMRE